ncbi:beta-ketoacyl-ACP reductase [Desulfosarcina ovata subsp. sediminis]|uniref:Beta-ketoacyl-ACP reductase n=1 Tax=Desulfosarcina ovata subsp. sediminis TaxID=885957 RepID=A0A5K7ZJN9_9BACT|nr:3-oxoacyl-ACP reductase FabG [Desulfosarcina ovata]BBO81604.1 beta-ketoacyl-ACP reductase [Desulfosarcina ovata subsp. sediminis]
MSEKPTRNPTDTPVALVTGASKGIGQAICIEMARSGYHVIVNYLSDREGAEATLAAVRAQGGDGACMGFNVADETETRAAVEKILSTHRRVDALINNAGRVADELFVMMTPDKWRSVIDITLQGFYNVTRPVLEKMIVRKSGSIVSIASVAGIMGNRGQANYAAAKAGLIGASRSVAAEVARLGIRVNVVAPGLIRTGMIKDAPIQRIKSIIPMARLGEPEEVGRVVRFLCSDDASYITGQVISVNGGMF